VQGYRERIGNRCRLLFVVPDYYEDRPKACMNGWGAVFLAVAPDGLAMPCHNARHLPGLELPNVRNDSLAWIWNESPAFQRYRGDAWMAEPCRSCPEKSKDFGGCRCQAYMIAGDAAAADPVCAKSPLRPRVDALIRQATQPAQTQAKTQPILFRADAASRGF
jgi:pyrroloquinoline quinone biosynthesis protein E